MQSFRLIRKTQLTILSALLLSGVVFGNPIGDIVEQTGNGFLTRNDNRIGNDVGTEILLKDEAQTVNGRMKIVFLDAAGLLWKRLSGGRFIRPSCPSVRRSVGPPDR